MRHRLGQAAAKAAAEGQGEAAHLVGQRVQGS